MKNQKTGLNSSDVLKALAVGGPELARRPVPVESGRWFRKGPATYTRCPYQGCDAIARIDKVTSDGMVIGETCVVCGRILTLQLAG